MNKRRLGRSGIEVSEIGFGAWGIGRRMWKGGNDRESMAALHQAVDEGIDFFDTALAYGDGHSETLIGRLLKETPASLTVATKIPPLNLRWPAQGSVEEAFPVDHIVASTEKSLRNLGVDCIELTQLHVWSPDWIDDLRWHDTLCRLKDQGKIRHFGVSISDHDPDSALRLIEQGLIETVQVIYNIFDQSPAQRLFPLCGKQDVGVIVRVPFDEGALTGTIDEETHFSRRDWRSHYFRDDRKKQVQERVARLLSDLDLSSDGLPQAALRFCLQAEAVGTVIPGMRRPSHVISNAAVSGLPPFSEQELKLLKRHTWEKNFYR